MKEKLRFKKLSLLMVLLFVASLGAHAQTKSLSGVVTDNTGEPLPGVTVVVKGTAQGTVSDIDGKYTLRVPESTKTIVFSYIGMKSQEVALGSKSVINAVLEPESFDVDEVVVVGYGTQKKRDLTGSITSVDNKAIEQRQAVNVFDALQGAAAGVQISSVSGAPGATNNIQIRGASTFDDAGVSPLYVVDNVIVEDIDNINPGDIKSIEILKDAASSAIYGARSANGVVIITTKSGEAGTPKIDVRVLKSFSSISNKIPQVNAFERILNDATTRGAVLEKYRANNDSVGLINSTNYFYQDLLTRTAVRNDVSMGISGGTDKLKYMASLGYIGDEGVILTSYNNKFTGRFNVDFQISKKLKSMTRMSFSNSKTNSINEGGVFQTSMRRPPNMILFYPDGSYAPYYDMGGNKNPLQELTARDDLNDRYQATLYQALEFKFNNYLSFQTSVTGNFDLRRSTKFASKELDSNGNEDLRKNTGSDNTTWAKIYQGDAYLSYMRTFGSDHSVNAMVGSSVETGEYEYLNFDGSYFVTESIHTMNMASTLIAGTTASDYAIAGFFGRLGYAYKGKYLFNSNVRYDGSSRFGQNERWGLFPSASLGWRFSDESFMNWSDSWLSDAKLRASWGVTGNDRVGYYESQTRYTSGTYFYNGISGVIPVSTYGNPNLHWEETRQLDYGIDLNMFDGRVSFTADYYIKETSDLLSNLNLPYTSGYNTMRVNLASIENKGLELSLSGYPIRNKKITWQTTINWWNNKNTITELAREDYIQNSYYYVAKGKSAGLFYGYKNLGIYEYDFSNAYTDDYKTRLTPVLARDNHGNVIIGLDGQPTLLNYTLPNGQVYEGTVAQLSAGGVVAKGGDVIWENMPDATGALDNKIDDNDRTVLGQANPDWYGSWSNTVSYKNFTLSFNFYTSWGGLVYNKLKRYYTSWGGNTHMQLPEYIRTGWIYQGQKTDWYSIDTRNRKTINRAELSDFYLEDASFIRLRNVRLSYNVDNKYLKNSFVKGCMVYVYGNNLLTWTNYSGYDPEVGGGVLTPGTDDQAYPRKREIGFGVNVNF
jgi:TonB-linked SusC/RagA family outer membrane protein